MSFKKVTNQIEMCRKEYESDFAFQAAVGEIAMFLMNNDYVMTLRYDEKSLGIIVVEFETAHRDWGAAYPYWLLPEQADKVGAE